MAASELILADEDESDIYDEDDKVQLVEAVLKGEKDIYAKDRNGNVAIFIAAANGWIGKIEQLIDKDKKMLNYVDVDETLIGSEVKRSAVYFAILHRQFEVLEFLVSKGADLNSIEPDDDNRSILNLAFKDPDRRFFDLLVTSGYNINQVEYHFSDGTVLHQMSFDRSIFDEERVNLLLENGADLLAPDTAGRSVIHLALFGNNDKALQVLLPRFKYEGKK